MKIIKNRATGLERIEKLSVCLDSKYTFPGLKFKYGLDPILGLFPVLGDISSFAISCALLLFMARHGASRKVVILMAGNIILDTVVGSIPILGNIFDFAYKANNRNIRLLKRHYEEGKYQGSGKGILLLVGAIIIISIFLIVFSIILLGKLITEFSISFF